MAVQQIPATLIPQARGCGQQLGILRSGHNDIGKRRLMAVNQDVHLVRLQHAQVDARAERVRLAEQHVRDIGGDHRTAPAVGQRRADRGQDQVLGVVVHAHVRHVQPGDDLAVDPPRRHARGRPVLPLLFRSPAHVGQGPFLLAELLQERGGQLPGKRFLALPLARDTILFGQGTQFRPPAHAVGLRLPLAGQQQSTDHLAPVVAVGRRADAHVLEQVPGDDDVRVGAANALFRPVAEGVNPAGAHEAVAAADSELAEAALRLLGLEAVPCRRRACPARPLQHLLRRQIRGSPLPRRHPRLLFSMRV